jgi:hypothetical protein
MNMRFASLFSAALLTLLVAASATAQTNRTKSIPSPYITPVHANTEPQRSMLGGDEIVLTTEWQLDANCKSVPLPTIKVRKEPKGGTLTFRETKKTINARRLRETCGTKEIDAVDIVYKARGDFVGADKAEIDVGYQMGITRKATYTINVRKAAANARETIIEGPEVVARRSTFAGNRIVLGNLHEFGPNCEPLPPPVARILKDASGGTLTFRESKTGPVTTQARERCKGKTFEAIEVNYQSRPDFSGTETIDIEIAFQAGKTRKVSYTIDVQGAPSGSREIKAEDQPREQNFKRQVFSGNEVRIASPNNVRPDCTTGEIADIRVVNAPSNGDLRLDTIKMPVNRGANNSRGYCNGKEIEARAVFYKPKDGFAGEDHFTIDVDFKTGKIERFSYDMRVR